MVYEFSSFKEFQDVFNHLFGPYPESQEEIDRVIERGHHNIDVLYGIACPESEIVSSPTQLAWHYGSDAERTKTSDTYSDIEDLKKYKLHVNTNPVVIIE